MTTIEDRYPEMPMAGNDLALARLVRDLDRVGRESRTARLPAQHDAHIVRALQERRAAPGVRETTAGRTRSILPRHRSLALATLVVSILLVTGATYATVPVLSRVFDLGGASVVIQSNLGKEVNLSQRLAGYTMTIKRVYADPNRVLIAYTIRPRVIGHRLWDMSTNLTVTDAQGTVLPERSLVGYVGGTEPETTLQGFDAAAIAGAGEFHLHLTVPWIEAMEQLHAPSTPRPGQPSGEEFPGLPRTGAFGSVAIARPVGERDPWVQIVRTYGPISFDLTVPVTPGREVLPQQQVRGGGVTATLERVVISPTETRLYVSGLGPNTFGILSTGDGEVRDAASTSWRWHGMTVYSFFTNLMAQHGNWTLAVKPMPALRLPPGVTPPSGSTPARGGPWTFHFVVP